MKEGPVSKIWSLRRSLLLAVPSIGSPNGGWKAIEAGLPANTLRSFALTSARSKIFETGPSFIATRRATRARSRPTRRTARDSKGPGSRRS